MTTCDGLKIIVFSWSRTYFQGGFVTALSWLLVVICLYRMSWARRYLRRRGNRWRGVEHRRLYGYCTKVDFLPADVFIYVPSHYKASAANTASCARCRCTCRLNQASLHSGEQPYPHPARNCSSLMGSVPCRNVCDP